MVKREKPPTLRSAAFMVRSLCTRRGSSFRASVAHYGYETNIVNIVNGGPAGQARNLLIWS